MMNQKFAIFPEDEKVIEAAIKLGDWIVFQPETTNEEKAIVQEVQAALRKLPEVTLGLSADYEFSATSIEVENWDGKEPVPKGEERLWSVSYSQGQDANREVCAIVEIFNIFHPYPRRYYEEFAGDEMEFYLYKRSTEKPMDSTKEDHSITEWQQARIDDWIKDTQDPEKFKRDGVNFEIEVNKWKPNWLTQKNE